MHDPDQRRAHVDQQTALQTPVADGFAQRERLGREQAGQPALSASPALQEPQAAAHQR